MTPDEMRAFADWFRRQRGNKLTQGEVADKLTACLGYGRSQTWVSSVERGQAEPTTFEVVFLAASVGGDPVEALEISGYLKTPVWARNLERRVERLQETLNEVAKKARP